MVLVITSMDSQQIPSTDCSTEWPISYICQRCSNPGGSAALGLEPLTSDPGNNMPKSIPQTGPFPVNSWKSTEPLLALTPGLFSMGKNRPNTDGENHKLRLANHEFQPRNAGIFAGFRRNIGPNVILSGEKFCTPISILEALDFTCLLSWIVVDTDKKDMVGHGRSKPLICSGL
jgi:hypothetical protein